MKKTLLFLMAFFLMGVGVSAQSTTINAVNVSATYGDAPKSIGATFTPVDPGVTLTYSTSNATIADVNSSGMVTFKASSTQETPTITIKAMQGATELATKVIDVNIASKNMHLLPPTNAVQSKAYDGTTNATLKPSQFFLDINDVVGIDGSDVQLNFATVVANFDTKDVGTNKNVTLSQALSLQGSRAFCYTLIDGRPTLKGDITVGTQPVNFGLLSFYTKPRSDLKLELTPNVKETILQSQITAGSDVVSVAIAADNKVTITFLKTGTANIRFYTNETTNYQAASTTSDIVITITAPTTTNNFTFPTTTTFTYGDAGKSMAVTGVEDNATVAYTSSNTAVATISATGALTILSAGSTTITAKSAQTLNRAETIKTANVTVNKKDISITGVTVDSKTYDASPTAILNWTNASFSGLISGDNDKVAIGKAGITSASFDNANAGINKNVVINGTGANVIAGTNGDKSSNYNLTNPTLTGLKGTINKANQVANLDMYTTRTVYVNAPTSLAWDISGTPTITRTSNPNTGVTFGDAAAAQFNIVTFANPGTYTVTVTTTNDTNYNNGTGTTVYTVLASNKVIFTNTAAQTKEYGFNGPLTVSASYSGGSAVITNYSSSQPSVVDVNATGVINVKTASGIADITVTVAGTANYDAATATVRVTATKRELSIGGITVNDKTYDGTTTAQVTGSMTIGNKVGTDVVSIGTAPTLTFQDKNVGTGKIMTVTGGTLTGANAALYAYPATYHSGADINLANQQTNLGLPTSLNLKYGEAYTFAPVVSEASTFNVAYSTSPNPNSVVSIDAAGKITYKGIGSATIYTSATAKPGVTCNYNDMTASTLVQVGKGTQIITAPSVVNAVLANGAFSITPAPTGFDNPTFKYEATNNDAGVIEVNATTGVITPKKAGSAKVLITAMETALYMEKKQSVDINISDVSYSITTQPVGGTVCTGTSRTFSVVSTAPSPSYKWYFNGVVISGATSSSYTIASVTAANAGEYFVEITSGASKLTSSKVTLTVEAGTVIRMALTNHSKCAGLNDTLKISATGKDNLTYKWYFKGGVIANQTDTAYIIPNLTTARTGEYRVEVIGCNTVSSTGVLTVVEPITATPVFGQAPDTIYTKGAYTVEVGPKGAGGYAGATRYVWNWKDNTNASFAVKETTTNINTLTAGASPANGGIEVTIKQLCGPDLYVSKNVKFLRATGIDNVVAAGMKVYPNPVGIGEPLNIDLGDGNYSAKVYIYNVTGALLVNANLSSQTTSLPVNLKSGIYTMRIQVANGKVAHHKFIVK